MDDTADIGRRTFVRSAATVSLLGTALAGCSGGSSGGGGGGGGEGENGDSGGAGSGGDGGDGSGSDGSGETRSFGGWMSDVGNYDGVAEPGGSEVTVTVGAQGNGGAFAYDPPAISVDPGTTVVWEWNGEGGTHNVEATEGGSFESDLTDEDGFTFEQTFDEAGTVKYQCTPHASLGMKGVVVVE